MKGVFLLENTSERKNHKNLLGKFGLFSPGSCLIPLFLEYSFVLFFFFTVNRS
jgi:hypothetical protein